MPISQTTLVVGDQEIILETGRFAQQASAAVTARVGDTVVLATVVMGRANEALGYFPLSVDYQEKLYAGGKIKGSRWVKRDGRPSDDAILKARLIDRTIRPLFPKGLINEIQVIVTVLSADKVNDADMPAMLAVSAALSMSKIPWEGPIAALRVGLNRETQEFMLNPTFEARENSDLELVVSGTKDAVVMLEAGANEVSEEKMLEAFKLAADTITTLTDGITKFAIQNQVEKVVVSPKEIEASVISLVQKEIGDQIPSMVEHMAKLEPVGKDDVVKALLEKHEDLNPKDVSQVIDDLIKKEARRLTLEKGIRPDGRKPDEIRALSSEVGLLPRTHGSAMFLRGQTQALTITTLGSPSLNQLIENMEGEEEKRYIHHYMMPPYTVGETGRVGWPSRREVGHGALAERAIEPMIPSEADFPYTILVVTEIMSSNGSTSMASVCGSTLSLMDAGVPLKKPVAGIAMGLLKDGDKHVVLSDIQGMEDHTGDMDFKVAGTKDGITAMQMDIKIKGIPHDILTKALEQAKVGRLHILEHMLTTLSTPRPQLSPFAPKIVTITIPAERIGEIIGPGGKIIRNIIETSGAEVDIEEDGRVFLSAIDEAAIAKARDMIEGILKVIEPGEEYDGVVTRIENFGAFVEIAPGKSGLVHVSRLSPDYVKDAHDIVSLDQTVHVRVTEIDNMGRINLTMLSEADEAAAKERRGPAGGGGRDRFGSGGGRGGDRGPRRDFSSRGPRR
jgi:polyribonucleotide nucleotidyltransferase